MAIAIDLLAETPPASTSIAPAFPAPTSMGGGEVSIPMVLAALGGAGSLLAGTSAHDSVPEPASILVLAGALAAVKLRRKHR